MSWEESGRIKHPCPCGEGTWDEVTRSNDWGQSESYTEINCAKCKKTHRVKATGGHDKGIPTVSYRLVPVSQQG